MDQHGIINMTRSSATVREVWAQEQLREYVEHELDNAGWNRRNTWMLCYVVSFSWLDTERLSRACCDHKSREYALSLCGVTFRDTLCASRASFSRVYHHNQRVVCLRLCRQRVKHQPKEKLGLDQRSGATDFRSKIYRVSTCTFPTDIRFRS